MLSRRAGLSVTARAARLLYPKYGRLFNHVNLCSYACQSANIQQESRAVAGVLGLKFAIIIHWPKLTASVPVKILKNERVTVLEIAVVDSCTIF